MTPLTANLVNGTIHIVEASTVLAAAMAAGALRLAQPSGKARRRGPINSHTLTDIGVESGTLTWLR